MFVHVFEMFVNSVLDNIEDVLSNDHHENFQLSLMTGQIKALKELVEKYPNWTFIIFDFENKKEDLDLLRMYLINENNVIDIIDIKDLEKNVKIDHKYLKRFGVCFESETKVLFTNLTLYYK